MSLTAIAEALAALCEGTATIEDAAGRTVVRAGAEVGNGVPLHVDVTNNSGYAGLIRLDATATRIDLTTVLDTVAPVVARHLAELRVDDDSARHRDLAALLRGPDTAAIGRLGLDETRRYTVVAFAAQDPAGLLRAIGTYWTAFRQPAEYSVVDGTLYALVVADIAPNRLTDVVRRAVASAHQVVRAGIAPAGPPAEISHGRRLADQVLRVVVAAKDDEPVRSFDEVRHRLLLLELRDAAACRPDLALDAVTRIAEHDSANHTAYLPTLRAYLDAFGDVAVASSSVSVHHKTFRYRLRRIAELFGLRLTDPDERLAVHLALRLSDA